MVQRRFAVPEPGYLSSGTLDESISRHAPFGGPERQATTEKKSPFVISAAVLKSVKPRLIKMAAFGCLVCPSEYTVGMGVLTNFVVWIV